MSDLGVRIADERDVPDLCRLAEEFMPLEACRKRRNELLAAALKNSGYQLLVAELEGEIVGFIDQWIVPDFAHGTELSYIQNLYVTPEQRGKGVGSQLLEEIIRGAENRGVSEVHVVTEFENEPAIQLYRSHGLVDRALQLERELE
ncbi:GNAT family N-acetyltransferase [Candidatus Bathyarchaeota archaeon]|nr:GNAT family N-acetyltransferase [Candidatus Bathyarchaeota archaeon]NIR17548.1 GNAT family N-acetyltransferase [Desulfobacterales bacterium]NIU81236.1 GNAT family N-acetyltransferase [Candidatus Bathyarchaeota archaeon]NIV67886.1 GNAT family N-acetyltransferase [Candidatus Bathyarchaeota archaeon]NIW16330.1 GNAT family N-acetyltransferase [Candidatus Bathyarchaeota archaeon]